MTVPARVRITHPLPPYAWPPYPCLLGVDWLASGCAPLHHVIGKAAVGCCTVLHVTGDEGSFTCDVAFLLHVCGEGATEAGDCCTLLYFTLQDTEEDSLVPFYFEFVEKGLSKNPPLVPGREEPEPMCCLKALPNASKPETSALNVA
jgi:hypothetical protein